MRTKLLLSCCGLVGAALLLAGCSRSAPIACAPAPTYDQVELGGIAYQVSGPYNHENLVVFLLHGKSTDDAEYTTLDQGLKDGTVKVSENEKGAEVRELTLENLSDKPLFLQEGDRISGGQQDRTLVTSLVVPPKSGKMPVPTMCIEQGRWTAGRKGQDFEYTANAAFAPKEVRQAAKISKDQQQVWNEVAQKKSEAEASLMVMNQTSSLNEAFDSAEVKKVSDKFAEALKGCLADHPDAVGVAIAVNGKIEEVNIYPNHQLLSRLYPRLIQSYAFQATVEKDKAKDAPACNKPELVEFVTKGKDRQPQPSVQVNPDNRNEFICVDGAKTECRTEYKGQPVHQQIINAVQPKQPAPNPSGRQAPALNQNPVDNVPNQQPLPQPPAPQQKQ